MPVLDAEAAFASLKTRVAEALQAQFPFEGTKRRLECVGVIFDEKAATQNDPHHIDNIEEQYKARTEGKTWGVPVRAKLRLIDKTNGHVVEESTVTLARVPKLTRRYSYIVDGNERQHDSVFRLKSRPYHIIAANGDLVGRWNLARGRGFDIDYDPKKGKMSMGVGESNIPLYSILRVLNVTDAEIKGAWGDQVFAENQSAARYEKDVEKLYAALKLKLPDHAHGALSDKITRLRAYFADETEVRPEMMKAVFGRESSNVDGKNLLASSSRLLDIQRGRTKDDPKAHELPDDRQALSAKYLTTTEDFIVEAIHHSVSEVKRKIADNLDRPDVNIDRILPPNTYNKVIGGTFAGAQRPDQTNPLQFLSGYMRTTIRGKDYGGVGGERINLDADKQINPTHLGFLDPIQSPESGDAGIALHLPLGVMVTRAAPVPGSKSRYSTGQDIKTKVYDVTTGTMVSASPGELEHAVVAYPDQVTWQHGKPVPIAPDVVCYDEERGTAKRPWKNVRYVLPSSKALFSFSANLIPFLSCDSGNRATFAAKQQEQALALVHREQPLVQVKTDGPSTFEHVLGTFASHRSPVAGTVTKIEPGAIHVSTGAGEHTRVQTYKHYPLNGGKGMLHATPVVKVGDKVEKGTLLADTNFTKDGVLAMGKNLRVAYVPYHGYNFEDSVIVSESAAKKMASAQMIQEEVVVYPGMIGGEAGAKSKWGDHAVPERKTAERMNKLDDRGIVKEGTVVVEGDILVAVLTPPQPSLGDAALARIGKGLVKEYRDASLVWDHSYPGKVVSVIVTTGLGRKTVVVHVEAHPPMTVGDKVTGRHGNKGVVGKILPDHQMPFTGTGENKVHAEVLLSPAGVVSRMNIGQVLETAASKIAEKTGKPYVVENFVSGVDYSAKVQKELKEHGLTDTEEMFDPATGRSLGQIMVGKQYLHQLHHMVEKKLTARSFGGYTSGGDAPAGAGVPGGGQKMDMLTTYSLLSHGAKANLREAQTIKSDGTERSDGLPAEAVWNAVMSGRPLPPPEPSRGMKNFLDYLRAMGVNVTKRGDDYKMSPMTDAHLLGDKSKNLVGISNGEIKLPEKANKARGPKTIEESGGLFDPRVTGGLNTGTLWSHVKLAERMPNPLFETAIQSLTGLKKKEYDALVGTGTEKNGFDILVNKLKAIDVDAELAKDRARIPKLKHADLAAAVKRIRYLEALKETGFTPYDAYTNQYLPVLPPAVRRVAIGLDGTQVTDDRNNLYLHVGYANGTLKLAQSERSTPFADVQKARAELYQSIRNLKIEGGSQTAGKPRHLTGLMELLTGKVESEGAPKESLFQRGVLSRRQDLSGRSTIIPETALGLDEIGLPVPLAMEMYRPFIVRELVRDGHKTSAADKMVRTQKDHPQVLSALDRALAARPVMFKRDPALHKFSIMGFNPKVVPGKAIQMHPLVCGGFGADYDGDAMALYAPISDEAVEEVRKMAPSKNLFSPTHFGLMNVPSQDSLLGLYQATRWGSEADVHTVKSSDDAIRLMNDGKIKPTDVVLLDGKKTTPGRLEIAKHLPAAMGNTDALLHDPAFRFDSGGLRGMLDRVGKEHEGEFARVVDAWKNIGNRLAYLNGSSFSIHDFHDGTALRNNVLAKYKKQETTVRAGTGTHDQKDKAVVGLYQAAQKELKDAGIARYNGSQNRVWEWAQAGARGGWSQFSQLVYGPMLVDDLKRKTVPVPITHSYGEGMPISEYWASMHGARKGTLDRVQGTMEPGAVSKDIMNTAMGMSITAEDCGATEGTKLGPRDADAMGRYLAKPVKIGHDEIPAGTVMSPALATRMVNAGVLVVPLRSPLHCRMQKGICARCFGHAEAGKLHAVGVNIGTITGQALGEPVVQLVMKQFHCLHEHSIVLVRRGERIYHTTLGMIFTCAPNGEERAGEEWRVPIDLEVWDRDQWVRVTGVCRHPQEPGTSMVFTRARSGYGIVSQDNHPHMLQENTAVCPTCNTYPKHTRGRYACRKCGWKWDGHQDKELALCVEPQELTPKSHRATLDRGPTPTSHERPPLQQGWLAGIYCAEGCIHARDVTGADYKVGIGIGQKAGTPIYERIGEALRAEYGADRKLGLRPNGYQLYSCELAEHYEFNFGRYSRCKSLPDGWSGLPSQWLFDFVSGVLDGDGTLQGAADSKWVVCRLDTTSFALAQQVHWILRGAGVPAHVFLSPRRGLSLHQGYAVTFVVTVLAKKLLSASLKLQSVAGKPEAPDERFGDVVDYVKPVFFGSAPYVYDLETESGHLFVNGFWTHNSGGASGGGSKAIDAFARVKQLFDLPEKLPDSAVLADVSGVVSAVHADARGGHTVTIDGKEHRVVTGHLLPSIVVGAAVHRGDALSSGPVNPHDLLRTTHSIHRVRDYLTNELMHKDLYGGLGVRRRNVETVVKGMTNLTEITDAPADSEFLRGQLAPLAHVEAMNAELAADGRETVKHQPKLRAMEQIPLAGQTDWLARLNYQRLKDTYIEGAQQGWKSNVHDHPIAGLAHGAEFGMRAPVALQPPTRGHRR